MSTFPTSSTKAEVTGDNSPTRSPYPRRRLWGVPVVLLLSVFLLIGYTALGLLLVGHLPLLLLSFLVPLCVYTTLIALFLRYLWGDRPLLREGLLLKLPSQSKAYAKGVGAGLLLYLALQVTYYILIASGVKVTSSTTTQEISGPTGGLRWVILLLLVPVVIPFFEEVFFRCFLYHGLQQSSLGPRWGHWVGLVVSTLIFGLVHYQGSFATVGDWLAMAWPALLGAVNCFLLRKSDSVVPSYLCHLTYNGVQVLPLFFMALGAH